MYMRFIIVVLLMSISLSGCMSNPEREFLKEVTVFSNYSTVNWDVTIKSYYHPCNDSLSQEIRDKINGNFPEYEAAVAYRLLEIARRAFHQKSLLLRAEATEDVIEALDATESMFDTIFMRYIEQDYYLGLLGDTYTRIMEPAIDDLVEVLRENRLKNKR